MYYAELLRVGRSALIASAVCVVAALLNTIIVSARHVHVPTEHATGEVPFFSIFAIGALVASIFATIIGGLGDENDGHLSVAWTRPASRARYAMQTFAIDVAAIVAVYLVASAAALVVLASISLTRWFSYPADSAAEIARFTIAPIAFFGLVQALTASLAKQAGVVRGLSWVALLALLVLDAVRLPGPLALLVKVLNFANPAVYIAFQVTDSGQMISVGMTAAMTGLVLIATLGLTAAVLQWRRLEA